MTYVKVAENEFYAYTCNTQIVPVGYMAKLLIQKGAMFAININDPLRVNADRCIILEIKTIAEMKQEYKIECSNDPSDDNNNNDNEDDDIVNENNTSSDHDDSLCVNSSKVVEGFENTNDKYHMLCIIQIQMWMLQHIMIMILNLNLNQALKSPFHNINKIQICS